eukprot:3404337-Rhodomonas_salina.1
MPVHKGPRDVHARLSGTPRAPVPLATRNASLTRRKETKSDSEAEIGLRWAAEAWEGGSEEEEGGCVEIAQGDYRMRGTQKVTGRSQARP